MKFAVIARTLLLLLALAACNAPTTAPTRPPMPTATTRSVPTASTLQSPAPTTIIPTATFARATTARLNDPFTLKGSEWVTLDANDSRVFFTNVLEDSRCPINVNCYQAGGVRVLISLETGGKLAHFDLSTKPADRRTIGSYNGLLVELMDVAPPPRGIGTPFPLGDYQVTLRVRAGSLGSAPPRIGEPFTLKPGQSADLGDVRLSFESVKQDSRCPARALCATSGTVTLATLFQAGGSSERYLLDADARAVLQHTVAGYLVLLNGLSPYPQNEFAKIGRAHV
jgi:hypothetical protein